MVELLKRNTMVDHGLDVGENQKNKSKYLEALPTLLVPPKRQKWNGRVGQGNEVRKYIFPLVLLFVF